MVTEEISFEDLGLDEQTLAAVAKKGFTAPSPIQVLAIPRLLSGDANIIAKARTGTGKTAAFGLPLIQNLRGQSDHVRAIILEPTRELAVQTCTELQSFASDAYPRTAVLYGGASMGLQIKDLRRGAEIVVGTPGRIQDHIERGTLNIEKIDYFILDEGDEMLDMGFVDDIEAIFAKANPSCRILLFSATMPAPILKIAQKFMGDYEIVEEEGITEEPLLIEQKYWVVRENEKIEALVRLIDISPNFYGLVFTQTKADADMVSRMLDERGYEAAALHGDIPQSQREKILARFRSKKTRILVATDVAARGIDISGLSHVVNYSLPFDGATYVHRIGRTGRAGTSGCAVTFVRPDERRKLGFLQAAVRRASKGEMIVEEVPSVDSVLDVKRVRLFTDIKIAIGLEKSEDDNKVETKEAEKVSYENDEIVPLEETAESVTLESKDGLVDTIAAENDASNENAELAENSSVENENVIGESDNSEEGSEQGSIASNKCLVKTSPVFEKMAEDLCDGQNPQAVLAAILAVTYGKSLDKSHYGAVASSKASNAGDQIRLFVQLGRRDGYNARSIADYFSGLLHIPGRMVDRIDVSSNFTLVSLPVSAGNKVLELSRRDRSLPHMHLDSKSGDDFGGGRSRSRGDRGSRGGRGDRPSRGGGFGRGEERSSDRYSVAKGSRGGRFNHEGSSGGHSGRSRVNVHVPTQRTGSASNFKKKRAGSEEF